MNAKRKDRRIERTQRTLRDALVSLMVERSWDEISVQDICDHADVGRSTFYVHYADKEQLLVSGFEDLQRALVAQIPEPTRRADTLAFAGALIRHADGEGRVLFRALVGRKTGQAVLTRFRDLLLELVRDELRATVIGADPAFEVIVRFISGSFLELLGWWVETANPLPAASLERMFRQMAKGAIKNAPS